MNAHSTSSHNDLLVLRVIEGRQAGAEYRLSAGLSVTLGHGFHHDIVLRMPADKDVSVRLDVKDGIVGLAMLAGNATLLGRPLSAGDTAQLPYYVPLVIGGVSFAIGSAESERWSETQQLRAAPEMDGAVAADPEHSAPAQAVAIAADPKSVSGQVQGFVQVAKQSLAPVAEAVGIERRWPLYAIIAATLLLAALLYSPVSNWMGREYFGAVAAQKILHDAGYKDVVVRDTPEGGLIVKGLVRNDAQLTRLRRLVSDRQPNAVIDVTTMDGLAAGVTDMLVSQGIDAEARVGRGKVLLIDSEYLPRDRQDELAQQIRKDVPALSRVMFKVNPERGESMLQYFFASEKYGLASFVDGDPSFISTANNEKWFKGSTLPTGHVILEIGSGRIRFEKNGLVEDLIVSEEAAAGSVESTDEATSEDSSEVADVKERKTT
jgi:type III secretion protein D